MDALTWVYAAYAVGALACWIPFARSTCDKYRRSLDDTDRIAAASMGALLASIWPVILLVLLSVWIVSRPMTWLLRRLLP